VAPGNVRHLYGDYSDMFPRDCYVVRASARLRYVLSRTPTGYCVHDFVSRADKRVYPRQR
jgi:hypothetical protein